MANGFEGREVLVARQGHTSSGRADTSDRSDVACNDLGHGDAVTTDHHGHLLNTFRLGSANGKDRFTLVDCTGVHTTYGDFTGMRVHPNLGDHHGEFGIRVAVHHGLTDVRLQVARPNVWNTVLLGINGAGSLVTAMSRSTS